MRAAVVVMPWLDAAISPLGAAALKAYLQENGVETDVFYFNLALADRLGPRLYSTFSRNAALWPEWFFAYHLFGRGGTGQRRESFEQLARGKAFKAFLDASGVPRSRLKSVLLEDIPAFLADCVEKTDWARYGLVGFSSTMYSHAACLKLARELKERFSRTIVFGGPNVEGEMGRELLARCPWLDFVVDGEGEEAFLAIARGLARGAAPPPGASRREASGEVRACAEPARALDLESLPPPDHRAFLEAWRACKGLRALRPLLTFETSRGCWWGRKRHCAFCGIPDSRLAHRAMPAARAARLIWGLHERYGANSLYAVDLSMSAAHLAELLPELARLRRERDCDLRLFYEAKAVLTRTQLEALARAGVRELLTGIESLTAESLERMGKGVRPIQCVQTLKWGQACGIKVVWNYLFAVPGEPASAYAEAAERALSITHLEPPAGMGAVRPDRSSPYRERPGDFGLRRPRPSPVYRRLYPEGFDLERLAYAFDFAPGDVVSAGHRGLGKLRETLAFWARSWEHGFFASRRGESCVELFDARPLRLGGGLEYRETTLTGARAALYKRCETVQTLPGLLAWAREGLPGLGQAEVEAVLDELARRRWLWKEDGRFLSLAVPVEGLPAGQRRALESLQAARVRGALPAFAIRVPLAESSP